MNRAAKLLEYLRGKFGPVGRGRIREDLRWPEAEVNAAITLLIRERHIRVTSQGEYELVPAAARTHDAAEAIARMRVVGEPTDTSKAGGAAPVQVPAPAAIKPEPQPARKPALYPSQIRKACDTCRAEKPLTQFFAGDSTCRVCRGNPANGHAKPAVKTRAVDPKPPPSIRAATKPPMPEAVRAIIQDLEAKRALLDAGIAALRAVYA